MKPRLTLVLSTLIACSNADNSTARDATTSTDSASDTAVADHAVTDSASTTDAATTSDSSTDTKETASDSATTTDSTPDTKSDGALTYDQLVLADGPVAFWDINKTGTEPDLTGNGHTGAYQATQPTLTTMPNGDQATDFDGASQYLKVPSSSHFSIPTTGDLTWEGWIRPDVLEFPHNTNGYVDWMGKCDSYSPTCEWEARMYATTTPNDNPARPNRMSAYVFNPTAGLGSAADWQPASGVVVAGAWIHIVGEYTTKTEPSSCTSVDATCDGGASKGSINIWVNGVIWSQTSHNPTGCMSQYCVVPVANSSTVAIGRMASDSYFAGAIGKVAIYDKLLSSAQIAAHFQAMTGKTVTGSCGNTCTY